MKNYNENFIQKDNQAFNHLAAIPCVQLASSLIENHKYQLAVDKYNYNVGLFEELFFFALTFNHNLTTFSCVN